MQRSLLAFFLVLSPLCLISTALAVPVDFVREVRPVFEKHCFACHGPDKQKNSFRLDLKADAMKGGDDHAPDIVAGSSAKSPLFQFVSGTDAKTLMPPKDKPRLSQTEIEVLKQWLDEGAIWPEGVDKAKTVDRTDWWSMKPLKKQGSHSIDESVKAKLTASGLTMSPPADAQTLIRRVYFDLTGLPPTPEEVAKFVAECAAEKDSKGKPSAYERLVDRLLDSPRYGERWARHWLDVVHYGETHGYDKDKLRLNAWPYRDYVIDAFNKDKPYARFIQEQLAGDVLYPGNPEGIVALGFIAAGPWDYIGHAEVPETKLDGKIARHLDRDDMVQNTIGTFCSLTIGCAQCHYHKFDAISQEDYYSLQAVFAAVDRTDVKYYKDAETMAKFTKLDAQKKGLAKEVAAVETPLKAKAGAKYEALSRRIDGASEKGSKDNPNSHPDYGYHSSIAKDQDTVKWVQVDLGKSMAVDSVEVLPCYDDFNKIGAGFGFPVRFKLEMSDDPSFKSGVTLLWRKHDATFMNDFPNPGLSPFVTSVKDDDGTKGRYVRFTAVKLAPRQNDYILALAEMRVFDEKGNNVALGKPVTALDSIEAPPRWRKSNLTDGLAPEARTQEDKQKLIRERDLLMLSFADEATQKKLRQLRKELQAADAALRSLPAPGVVYAGGIHTGTGAFRGTGPDGGKPRLVHVLKRGDIKNPAAEVGPGTIEAIAKVAHLDGRFELPPTSNEGARRAALAKWIADKNNPLTWRSIVNRMWQYHFGKGLVETANDFGRMGAQPTHPDLIDWLALSFRDDMGGSFKQLHRLIVCSDAYKQQSSPDLKMANQNAQSIDADNHLLWRQNRRKLDAESIRDGILAVSGKLDVTMGGPSFQDFVITHPEHSPHYQYDQHDPEDPKSWRRSIYRFIVRSQQQPFMTVMDCADPSMRVDKRNESLSALQALAMMNNGLIVSMSKHFAERVATKGDLAAQVRAAFELALSRKPSGDELAPLVDYARKEGLENVCRVLMNLNEFSFVD